MQRRGRRDPRRRFWKKRSISQDIQRHYSGRTLDVYDVWMLLGLLHLGRLDRGITVEEIDKKIHLTHDFNTIGIYDPEDKVLTIHYGPGRHYSLTLNNVEIQVPDGLREVKVRARDEWLITKRRIVDWDYAPFFKPQIHLEGVTWADEAIKAWIQRWEDGFAYVAIFGIAPWSSNNVFYEKEAYIAYGTFRSNIINLTQSYGHSLKIVPHRVTEYLGLEGRISRGGIDGW